MIANLQGELQAGTPARKQSSWNLNIFVTKTRNCLYLCGLFSCPNEYILFCRSGDWACFSSHCDTLLLKPEGPREALETATFILTTSVFGKWTKFVGSEEDIVFIWIGCDYRMGQGQGSKGTGTLGTGEGKRKRKGANMYSGLNK